MVQTARNENESNVVNSENRSKGLKFLLGSDCDQFEMLFPYFKYSSSKFLHVHSLLNSLRYSYKTTSSTNPSVIHHSKPLIHLCIFEEKEKKSQDTLTD